MVYTRNLLKQFFQVFISDDIFLQENEHEREEDEEDDADEPEHWEEQGDAVEEDLGIDVHPTPMKKINSLLFNVVYAILYLQVIHHISDNGAEYLLDFFFKIFQMFGANVNSSLLTEFCVGFPPSLYLARKLIKLDRDSFKRYAVCPSCHTLYEILIVFMKTSEN